MTLDLQNHGYEYDPETDELVRLEYISRGDGVGGGDGVIPARPEGSAPGVEAGIYKSFIDFTYNPNGSLTKENYVRAGNTYKERNFTYDYEERLKQVEIVDKSAGIPQLETVSRVNYAYDDSGNRVKKQIEGGETKYYLNQGLNLLVELDSSENISKSYIYGIGLIGTFDAQGGFKYAVQDNLGSTRVLTDDLENKITEKTYDPYGSVEYFESSGELSIDPDENIGFTNQEEDPETGLIYMNARYYNPLIGRFITEDLYKGDIGDAKSLNRYTYAANNPLKYTDPTGLWYFSTDLEEDPETGKYIEVRNAYSSTRNDGQPENVAFLVWVLTGNPIDEFPGLNTPELSDWRNNTYRNWDTWMWEDQLLPFEDWMDDACIEYGKDNTYGRKIDIEWMVDRTENLSNWLRIGANEIIEEKNKLKENPKWYKLETIERYKKFIEMVGGNSPYDIKWTTEYANLVSSNVSIGGVYTKYDKPNCFLLGYIAGAGAINLSIGKNLSSGYQLIYDTAHFDMIDLQAEKKDRIFIIEGYNFFKKYGLDFNWINLASAFMNANSNAYGDFSL